MSLVLTMMADPAGRKLGDGDVLASRHVLRALGCAVGEADWLAPGIACDLPFEGAEPETAEGVTPVSYTHLTLADDLYTV